MRKKVDDLVKGLGIDGISRSEVSRICKVLDEEVRSFLGRPIEVESCTSSASPGGTRIALRPIRLPSGARSRHEAWLDRTLLPRERCLAPRRRRSFMASPSAGREDPGPDRVIAEGHAASEAEGCHNSRVVMAQTDVLEVLAAADSAGVRTWLDGGWGVDALLGEETRRHADVDLVIELGDVAGFRAALEPAGFELVRGDPQSNFVLADGNGREIDVHPVRLAPNGDGIYRMEDGGVWIYPAEGFGGTGTVGGRLIACLTPDAQMLGHAGGYPPGETDFHDMARLQQRFGINPLPPYDRPREPYYRKALARIHHLGFGFHARDCAPGITELLGPVLERRGIVLELGCGSGLLTRHLIDAGHRVIATDASPAMLELAQDLVPDAVDIRQLTLPDDPIPHTDAIVSVGHVLSYLPGQDAIDRALVAIARALRPDGVVALDLCDLRYAEARGDLATRSWVTDEWVLITQFQAPTPDRFIRLVTIFTRSEDGTWLRDEERHDNVLIDTSRVPALMAEHGAAVRIGTSFGNEELPDGLNTVIGTKTR